MNLAPAIVFFIFLQSQPVAPGNGGMLQTWVLYDCPSEQLARQWAQAQFAQFRLPASVGIRELRVLPMQDTIYTEDGPIPAPWTALPAVDPWSDASEGHHTFYVMAPNKRPAPLGKVSPQQERESLRAAMNNSVEFNWDASKSWYYIVFSKHQAVLIKEVNAPSAAIVYAPLVRGTPAGDENAGVWPWSGITIYHQPSPAALSPH
jgi:hypothetical protein